MDQLSSKKVKILKRSLHKWKELVTVPIFLYNVGTYMYVATILHVTFIFLKYLHATATRIKYKEQHCTV
jgi:hypothetical protein